MDAPQRMNTEQAAHYLGLSPRTLEKLRLTGGGPSYLKPGRRVIYERLELDRWIEATRRRSTSDQEKAA